VSSLNAEHILAHLRRRVMKWSPDVVFWSFYVNDIHDEGGQEADILFPVRKAAWWVPTRSLALGRFLQTLLFSTDLGSRMSVDTDNAVNRKIEAKWQRVERAIVEGRDLLAQAGVPLAVVVFPSGLQLSRPWTAHSYQSRLAEICGKHGVPCIDILPALKRSGTVRDLYYGGDLIHPNARGHAAAAAEIVTFLETRRDLLAGE